VFDPTQLIFVTSERNKEMAAVSLIENKVKYVYAEIGKRKYFTIEMNRQRSQTRQNPPVSPNSSQKNVAKEEKEEIVYNI